MMIQIFLGYLLLINLTTFIVRGIDKWKAHKARWRISEKNLLILTGLGGFLGAIAGMNMFRHKTIKGKFLIRFWLITILRIIIFIYLLYNN